MASFFRPGVLVMDGGFATTLECTGFFCENGETTRGGDRFYDVVSSLCLHPRLSAIGINCTTPSHVTSLLKQGRHGMKSFVVYPNSGEKWTQDQGWCGHSESDSLASYVPEWVAHGAKIIGGCCRVGPTEIRLISQAVENLNNPLDMSTLRVK